MQAPEYSNLFNLWQLDPEVTFLNHGSYGATPRTVMERQSQIRSQLEREPLRFFMREFEPLLNENKEALAKFVGAKSSNLAFVPNATCGVNTILNSLRFKAGDQVLITSWEYNACKNAASALAARSGVEIVVAPLPLSITSYEEVISPIINAITPRTKLLLVNHIVSQTSVIMPIEKILNEMRSRDILTLVDGAHAPGMIPLDLDNLGADFYTGNCHKWMCGAKGSALLFVSPQYQDKIRPLVISHGANSTRTDRSKFQLEFDWTGTHDPSGYLSTTEAIKLLSSQFPGGCNEWQNRNNALITKAVEILKAALPIQLLAPSSMFRSMASFYLPSEFDRLNAQRLHDILLDDYQIELQIMPGLDSKRPILRISAQAYNSESQYEYLAHALLEIARQDRV